MHSTLVVENLFNLLRRLERSTSNSRVVAARAWHEVVCGQVLPEYDMQLPTISEEAKSVAPSKVPGTVFMGGPASSTLDRKTLKPLTEAVPTWPNQAPHKAKGRGIKWQSALAAEGNWDRLVSSWPSLMLSAGDWALEAGSKRAFLVLKSTPHGFLSLDTQIKRVAGKLTLVFPPWHPDAVRVHTVTDHTQWRVAKLQVMGPRDPRWQEGRVQTAYHLIVPGKGIPLLEHSAWKGFQGLSLAHLRRLWAGLPPESRDNAGNPAHEEALVKALARVACRNIDEEKLSAIWEARSGVDDDAAEGARASLAADALSQCAAEMEDELLEPEVVEYGAHLVEIAKEYAKKKKRRRVEGGWCCFQLCWANGPQGPCQECGHFLLAQGVVSSRGKALLTPRHEHHEGHFFTLQVASERKLDASDSVQELCCQC